MNRACAGARIIRISGPRAAAHHHATLTVVTESARVRLGGIWRLAVFGAVLEGK